MTFKDINFPKEYYEKKRPVLYKWWILSPLTKGSDKRFLDISGERDWYGVTFDSAFENAINKYIQENNITINNIEDLKKEFNGKLFVSAKIILEAKSTDEVIIAADDHADLNTDPRYDPEYGLLYASTFERINTVDLQNWRLDDLEWHYDQNTSRIIIDNKVLSEKVINDELTGSVKN